MIPLPTINPLDAITIPTHCTVPWDKMEGDERRRFCTQCRHAVHDVSALTTAEAIELLGASDRKPCLRIHRRTDGRVMTADCPVSRRERIWRWLRPRSACAAGLFALLFVSGCRTATQGIVHRDYKDAVLNALPESAETTPRTTDPPVTPHD